jgi:hypothetical protein
MTPAEILLLPHKIVGGIPVLLTQAEITQRQADDTAFSTNVLTKTINNCTIGNAIDAKAGDVRKRYITFSPGQDATYLS